MNSPELVPGALEHLPDGMRRYWPGAWGYDGKAAGHHPFRKSRNFFAEGIVRRPEAGRMAENGCRFSLLCVGASEHRRRIIEQLLDEHRYKLEFRDPAGWSASSGVQADDHDFIMVDDSGDDALTDIHDPARLVVIEGGNTSVGGGIHPVRVRQLSQLPGLLARLGDRVSARGKPHPDTVQRLRHETNELKDILDQLPAAIYRCRLDSEGGIVEHVSKGLADLMGVPAAHFLYRSTDRLLATIPPRDRRRLQAVIRDSMRNQKRFVFEHRLHALSGGEKWVFNCGQVRTHEDGSRTLEGVAIDLAGRRGGEQHLRFLASHDTLTGLANRALFRQQLDASVRRATRQGSRIAVLFVDLDRFKRINDSHGHELGDELLRLAASRLRRAVRSNDVIGRFGGDEFTVLVDTIKEPLDASKVASKILSELSEPFDIRGRRFTVGASIGISCYPGDGVDSATLIRNADSAMYDVKHTGRHGIQFFSGELAEAFRQSRLHEREIRASIHRKSFRVYYRPRFSLSGKHLRGLNMELRPSNGITRKISQEELFRIATESGELNGIIKWVQRELGANFPQWDRRTREQLYVVFEAGREPHVIDAMVEALCDTFSPGTQPVPSRVLVEFGEPATSQAPVTTARAIKRLHECGFMTSLDGLGFLQNALDMLGEIPVDVFRLDERCIGEIPEDRNGVALASAVIALARRMKMRVIAGDVTTEAQVVFLRAAGCDQAEGSLFGQPVSARDLARMLERIE